MPLGWNRAYSGVRFTKAEAVGTTSRRPRRVLPWPVRLSNLFHRLFDRYRLPVVLTVAARVALWAKFGTSDAGNEASRHRSTGRLAFAPFWLLTVTSGIFG